MARSKSSGRWLQEHFSDVYVKRSKQDGYRSRASYKLMEINEKDRLFRQGMRVIDLGAAPGGWSQVAVELVGDHGKVIASDILTMDPIAGVSFIQGDFTSEEVYEAIVAEMQGDCADLVISDMAPNMSGNHNIDQPAAMYLVELALDLARTVLKPGGNFVAKVFQGEGFPEYMQELKGSFERVLTRKPDASRSRSREVYLVGLGFRS
ncbi:23S rRNA methyltransferase [Pokkaliibacter plantistimulans]|uniref:Ribosomal RNA large subunit methyltransferase E n=1 Tax=Pokkaliibacter plantistimulans TaxID=1635171 RepID=A0ABX5LU16_9GAMM|nr:23S rRNA (uridine(2552)-2'-O)-methyltransferase RlmE [Pokkaliibacter plantistimulans]PXF30157.1 23S rRNA methyltransferase [Pokkaliibacter plantistimulans]